MALNRTGLTFGATVDDLKALMPDLELGREATEEGAETQPSEADAQRYLWGIAGIVRGRTGDIPEEDPDNAGEENPLYAAARWVVTLGAAVWLDSGSFPERTDLAETTRTGFTYKAYRDAFDDLLESLGLAVDGGDGGSTTKPDSPAASFPEPLFTRDRGF